MQFLRDIANRILMIFLALVFLFFLIKQGKNETLREIFLTCTYLSLILCTSFIATNPQTELKKLAPLLAFGLMVGVLSGLMVGVFLNDGMNHIKIGVLTGFIVCAGYGFLISTETLKN